MKDKLCILNFMEDISYLIDDKLNISFKIKTKKNSKPVKYPILLKPSIEIEVDDNEEAIKSFLSGESKILEQKYVMHFLELANINIIVFLVSFIKKQSIDMLFYDNMLIVDCEDDENTCLFLNERLIPYEPILKIKNTLNLSNANSVYKQSMEDISYFIKKKINTSISTNATLSYSCNEFKELQKKLNIELNSYCPDLLNIINLYEKMIEYKSSYFAKEENLLSDEELIEIIEEFNILKELVSSSFDVNIKSLPEKIEKHF